MLGIFDEVALKEKIARHKKRAEDAINFAVLATERARNGTPAEKAYYNRYKPLEYITSANLNTKAIEIIQQQIKALRP